MDISIQLNGVHTLQTYVTLYPGMIISQREWKKRMLLQAKDIVLSLLLYCNYIIHARLCWFIDYFPLIMAAWLIWLYRSDSLTHWLTSHNNARSAGLASHFHSHMVWLTPVWINVVDLWSNISKHHCPIHRTHTIMTVSTSPVGLNLIIVHSNPTTTTG